MISLIPFNDFFSIFFKVSMNLLPLIATSVFVFIAICIYICPKLIWSCFSGLFVHDLLVAYK